MPPREVVTPMIASCLLLFPEEVAPVAPSLEEDEPPELGASWGAIERIFQPPLTR